MATFNFFLQFKNEKFPLIPTHLSELLGYVMKRMLKKESCNCATLDSRDCVNAECSQFCHLVDVVKMNSGYDSNPYS